MTPEIRRDIHGRPVKVLGFIRDPKAKKGVEFVEILDKKHKPAADFVHTIVTLNGIEGEPIQTYTRLRDF